MKRVSTAGMKLAYCVEATAGTMPTASYTMVPEVTSAPSLFVSPNTADVTPLDETEMVQYLALLRDFGGALEYGANWNNAVDEAWNTTCVGAYETAQASDKAMWFALVHPELDNCVFFKGQPLTAGPDEVSANSPLTATLRIVPQGGWTYTAKPTITG